MRHDPNFCYHFLLHNMLHMAQSIGASRAPFSQFSHPFGSAAVVWLKSVFVCFSVHKRIVLWMHGDGFSTTEREEIVYAFEKASEKNLLYIPKMRRVNTTRRMLLCTFVFHSRVSLFRASRPLLTTRLIRREVRREIASGAWGDDSSLATNVSSVSCGMPEKNLPRLWPLQLLFKHHKA